MQDFQDKTWSSCSKNLRCITTRGFSEIWVSSFVQIWILSYSLLLCEGVTSFEEVPFDFRLNSLAFQRLLSSWGTWLMNSPEQYILKDFLKGFLAPRSFKILEMVCKCLSYINFPSCQESLFSRVTPPCSLNEFSSCWNLAVEMLLLLLLLNL